MDESEVQRIKEKNEMIRRAILVSQAQRLEGFTIMMEDLEEVAKGFQYCDVRGIKDLSMLDFHKGYVQAIEDFKSYLSGQINWANQPMIDEVTGEEEILNGKK